MYIVRGGAPDVPIGDKPTQIDNGRLWRNGFVIGV